MPLTLTLSPYHNTKLLAHLSYLALLVLITFGLKERPGHVREYVAQPCAVLLLLLGLVYSELRAFQLWWGRVRVRVRVPSVVAEPSP